VEEIKREELLKRKRDDMEKRSDRGGVEDEEIREAI